MRKFNFTPLAERLAAMPPAISGASGRSALFRACIVPFGYGLSKAETLEEMVKWNAEKCLPPFKERDLALTVEAASKSGIAPDFYLPREKGKPKSAIHSTTTSKAPASAPRKPEPRQGYDAATIAERAAMQAEWREVRPMGTRERGKLAHLRSLPLAAVDIATQCRRIMIDDTRPDCYVLTDGRTDGRGFKQYRRWDGEPFAGGMKSRNALHSSGKGFLTLGNRKLDPDELVFICEGAIGMIELMAIQWLAAPYARRWFMIAAHSAASTFAAEPELLKSIAGHHCRILPDYGKTGMDAARAWRDELRPMGCAVDFAMMPEGFQDLKVILAAGSDGVAAARSILTYPTPRVKGGNQ